MIAAPSHWVRARSVGTRAACREPGADVMDCVHVQKGCRKQVDYYTRCELRRAHTDCLTEAPLLMSGGNGEAGRCAKRQLHRNGNP